MCGVDKLDQLVCYYSFLHKSIKWWKKVFFWLLEVSVVNSYVIYKEYCTHNKIKPMQHLAYRRNLVQLTESIRASAGSCPGRRCPVSLERLQSKPHFLTHEDKRIDCVVCSDRDGKRHLTYYRCETCSDHPPLCPTECFKTYHTKNNNKLINKFISIFY